MTGTLWQAPPPIAPEWLEIDGRLFRRARWHQPYGGVALQYRECVPRDSAHLFVHHDGTWSITHTDAWNPDYGRPLRHFFADHWIGQALARVALPIALLLAVLWAR